jgi:hypothetical protein
MGIASKTAILAAWLGRLPKWQMVPLEQNLCQSPKNFSETDSIFPLDKADT